MEKVIFLAEALSALAVIFSMVAAFLVRLKRINEGQKCQLRADMLSLYYKNLEKAQLHQYELENFLLMYKAYKALKGNSFVDKIKEEVIKWKVIY